jgi:hypothetical protein
MKKYLISTLFAVLLFVVWLIVSSGESTAESSIIQSDIHLNVLIQVNHLMHNLHHDLYLEPQNSNHSAKLPILWQLKKGDTLQAIQEYESAYQKYQSNAAHYGRFLRVPSGKIPSAFPGDTSLFRDYSAFYFNTALWDQEVNNIMNSFPSSNDSGLCAHFMHYAYGHPLNGGMKKSSIKELMKNLTDTDLSLLFSVLPFWHKEKLISNKDLNNLYQKLQFPYCQELFQLNAHQAGLIDIPNIPADFADTLYQKVYKILINGKWDQLADYGDCLTPELILLVAEYQIKREEYDAANKLINLLWFGNPAYKPAAMHPQSQDYTIRSFIAGRWNGANLPMWYYAFDNTIPKYSPYSEARQFINNYIGVIFNPGPEKIQMKKTEEKI